jgi:UrcA family protein
MIANFGVIALALVLGSTTSSQPFDPDRLASERITYVDLDLSSPAGRMALHHRIAGAARRVCDTSGLPSLEEFGISARCYRHAMKDGLRQIDDLVAARGAARAETSHDG